MPVLKCFTEIMVNINRLNQHRILSFCEIKDGHICEKNSKIIIYISETLLNKFYLQIRPIRPIRK
ncbi:hypothetical protein BpHYR1_053891 [Brachionus plicatilis]|uniref:Uncharacterized protein n=1 Tax=Brachionus plicatilis TaxID=10195 RepID=A0A3M7T1N1_BRAPC|nr:hypothetical protein BpHYR1_053891 [Brachionus plicatilis]